MLERDGDGGIKDSLEALLRLGGALKIARGAKLVRESLAVGGLHGTQAPLLQLLEDLRVIAQVRLGPNKDEGRVWVVVADLGVPLAGV